MDMTWTSSYPFSVFPQPVRLVCPRYSPSS